MDNSQSDSSALHLSNSTPSINQDSSLQTSTTGNIETPSVDPSLLIDIDFSNITLPTETSDDITSNTSNLSKIETSITNTSNSSTNHTTDLKSSTLNLTKSTNGSTSEEPSNQDLHLPTPNLLSTSPLISQPALASINNTLPLPLIPPVYPFPLNSTGSPLPTDLLKNMQKYPFKAAIPRNQPFKARPQKPISPMNSSPRPSLLSNPLAAATVAAARKNQPLLQSRLPTQPLNPTLPIKPNSTTPVIPTLGNPLTTNLTTPTNPLSPMNNIEALFSFYNTTLEQLKNDTKVKFTEDFNKFKLNQLTMDQFIAKTKEYLTPKQLQTLQNLKLQIYPKSSTSEDLLNSSKKRKLEENNSSAMKKTKPDNNNNNSIGYMGPPPSRINQLFPIDTPGIGGNKVNNNTSKAQEIDVTKLDSESLGDVMKYVGVDLKEETDNILRDNEILNMQQQQINQTEDRSKAQSFLSIPFLTKVVEEITSKNDITKVDPDYYNCLAIAAQERIRGLVEQMILASKHRVGLLHDFFMEESKNKKAEVNGESYEFSVVVKDDVKKALQLIERHERDKERRERQRRGEEEDRGDGKDGEKGGSSKRKKNKTIKNKDVPDAVKQRITNETALRAAGASGKKYSWMTQSSNDEWRASSLHFHKSSSSQSKGDSKGDKKSGDEGNKGFDSKRSFGASKSGKSGSSLLKRKDGSSQGRLGSGNSKKNPFRRTISQKDMYRVILKDAIFILENDKYYKRSNLLYKWYTM